MNKSAKTLSAIALAITGIYPAAAQANDTNRLPAEVQLKRTFNIDHTFNVYVRPRVTNPYQPKERGNNVGQFTQDNSGNVLSNALVINAKSRPNGKIELNNAALGNSFSAELSTPNRVKIDDIQQTNSGNVMANALLHTNANRSPKVIELNNAAMGNSLSLEVTKSHTLQTGASQSNSGNVIANAVSLGPLLPGVLATGRPKSITINNAAIGNSLNITTTQATKSRP